MIPALQAVRAVWRVVHTSPAGSVLTKGRKDGESRSLAGAAAAIAHQFGCYAWESNGTVLYCGSFSKDYSGGQFKTNFEGRVYQYLVNHRRETDGTPKNTNAKVFDLLNGVLRTAPATLQLLQFESLIVDGSAIAFGDYAADATLVRAIERWVIWSYKTVGQCPWNDGED
jgi:hypothetical protein